MIAIDFLYLATSLLQNILRRETILAFFSVFSVSISKTQTDLSELFSQIQYELSFNGQTIYLQHFLNDQHDPGNRLIWIENLVQTESLYVFNTEENNENLYLWNDEETNEELVYLYNESEINALVDFIVHLPAGLVYLEAQLRANIESYKLPGIIYEIVQD